MTKDQINFDGWFAALQHELSNMGMQFNDKRLVEPDFEAGMHHEESAREVFTEFSQEIQ